MIQKIKNITRLLAIFLAMAGMFTSCLDKDFDKPDPLIIPEGEVFTIAELRQMFAANNNEPIKFTEDISVKGIITMDGSSGNIYRSAFLQDETAAINLRLMSPGGLYQGDHVRVNLKGTVLSEFSQMLQIDSVHTGNNVVKIDTRIDMEPTEADILTLLTDPSYQGKLVRLSNVEFHPNDLNTTWADAENLQAQNRILRDCSGNEILVRTSGYARFADEVIPGGNGTLVGILAQFNADRQLYVRSLDEVSMEGERCSAQDDQDRITIAEIRQLYAEGATQIPAGRTISGVITSDRANGNTAVSNAFLQDETGAIALRFSASHNFNMGDKISIFAGTVELSEFRGLLQVNNIPAGNATLVETGAFVEPEDATIENIKNNMGYFESRLVRITDATISGGSTFGGSRTLTDNTDNIEMFTRTQASFADATVPTGSITITGIVSVYDNPNFIIRNLDDIQE